MRMQCQEIPKILRQVSVIRPFYIVLSTFLGLSNKSVATPERTDKALPNTRKSSDILSTAYSSSQAPTITRECTHSLVQSKYVWARCFVESQTQIHLFLNPALVRSLKTCVSLRFPTVERLSLNGTKYTSATELYLRGIPQRLRESIFAIGRGESRLTVEKIRMGSYQTIRAILRRFFCQMPCVVLSVKSYLNNTGCIVPPANVSYFKILLRHFLRMTDTTSCQNRRIFCKG